MSFDANALLNAMKNNTEEATDKVVSKFWANIVYLEPNNDNPKGYSPISLPVGCPLEISEQAYKRAMPKSRQLLDNLLELAKQIPEGESRELNPVVGGLTIQIRHNGEAKASTDEQMSQSLRNLANMFK